MPPRGSGTQPQPGEPMPPTRQALRVEFMLSEAWWGLGRVVFGVEVRRSADRSPCDDQHRKTACVISPGPTLAADRDRPPDLRHVVAPLRCVVQRTETGPPSDRYWFSPRPAKADPGPTPFKKPYGYVNARQEKTATNGVADPGAADRGGTDGMTALARKRSLALSKVYGLLEPGPVLLLTTSHKGVANVMTMSWHTMLEFEPPLVGCVVSENDHSFAALCASRQCVLNIPTVELATQVVGCGNSSGARVDKFATFGLTPTAASLVVAPLIAECYANLECRVVDTRLKNRYNFFVLEVAKAWIDPGRKAPRTLHHRGYGLFMVAGDSIKLTSRMR